MKRLYKQAEDKIDYSYMFAEWLSKQAYDINSNANDYITKIYMNALKNCKCYSYIIYDLAHNVQEDFDKLSYQEITDYINDKYNYLNDEIFNYIYANKNAEEELGLEVSYDKELYYDDILWKWAEEEGLKEFCKKNRILEDNVNMNDAKQYFEKIAEELDWFGDARDSIFSKNMNRDALREYIDKNLDEFAKYIFKDIIKLRNEKYNEEKADYDEYLNREKAKDYMNNIMDNGIDYSKLGTNRILKRMYKDARKMK